MDELFIFVGPAHQRVLTPNKSLPFDDRLKDHLVPSLISGSQILEAAGRRNVACDMAEIHQQSASIMPVSSRAGKQLVRQQYSSSMAFADEARTTSYCKRQAFSFAFSLRRSTID
nr:hypothetical protein CFP56_50834 [Quercus suber]